MLEALQELVRREQWVAFTSKKLPISPNGTPASSADPQTWGTLDQAKFIRQVQGLPGVGYVFSEEDPYVGIDLDDAVDPTTGELYGWAREHVEALDSYAEFSPSGFGIHIIVRGAMPRRGVRRRLEGGGIVEAYASHRYFTVTGDHIPGTPTEIRDVDLAGWYARTFERPAETGETSSVRSVEAQWETPEAADWLPQALNTLPLDDYDLWIKIGMAIKAELGDGGFHYWHQWTSWSSYYTNERDCWRKWESFRGSGYTMATVVYEAEQRGFTMPRAQVIDPLGVDWDAWLRRQEMPVDPPGMDSGLALAWHSLADAYDDRSPFEPDLVGPGVIGTGDILLLFGPPKSMKSMAILDAARSWCQGLPWLGMTPSRPLRIALAQFEVKADQMRKRIHLADMSPDEVDRLRGRLFFTDRFTPVLNAEFVTQFAEQTLRAFRDVGGLDVLVIDPIANIYTGDNENDNAQMSRFLRQIKALRNAIDPKVAIVLVHHANKSSREDRHREPFNAARGGSALRGAYDAGMYLDLTEKGGLKLWLELRNGPRIEPMDIGFQDGRFHDLAALAALVPDGIVDPFASEPSVDAVALEVERILCEEAVAGRVYTNATFADTFAGDVIGSASTIKRELGRLATVQRLGWFRSVPGAWLEEPHHRSTGYLCCRGMMLLAEFVDDEGVVTNRIVPVEPDRMRHQASGRVVEVQSWPIG